MVSIDWVFRHTGFTKQYIEDLADLNGDFLIESDFVCTFTVNGKADYTKEVMASITSGSSSTRMVCRL